MSGQIVTEPFSSGYELVHGARVHTLAETEAIMDGEMYAALESQFGSPIVGYVGGLHYHFKPEQAIPKSAVAVPQRNHDDPKTLLIQR